VRTSATETLEECKQKLKTLKNAAAKRAKAIKDTEIEAVRHARSSQYQLSSLRMKLQNIMLEIDAVHKQLAVYPGCELETTTSIVRQLRGGDPKSLSSKTIFHLIQTSIIYAEQFLQYVQNGGLSAEPIAPEPDQEMRRSIQEQLGLLRQQRGDVVRELELPQESVRKVSLLHRSLHRLQHEMVYDDFHSFCMRIAAKAHPARPSTIHEQPRSIFATPLLSLPRAGKHAFLVKTAERHAKAAAARASAAPLPGDAGDLTSSGFKDLLAQLGLLPWKISAAGAEQVFLEFVPAYAQVVKFRGRRGIENMTPFEEPPPSEPRAPKSVISQMVVRAKEFANHYKVVDPRQARDRLRDPSSGMRLMAVRIKQRTKRHMRQMRRQARAQKQGSLEAEVERDFSDIKSESSEGGIGQGRAWLRKNAPLAISSSEKSPFHAMCSEGIVERTTEAVVAAEQRRQRVGRTRQAFLSRERAAFTSLKRKQLCMPRPGPVLLDVNHWCLHVDGDYLGYDREAEFALSADAKYVFMPDTVADGGPVLFRVHAVLGRWRLLLVVQTPDFMIERFKRATLCRHGVARHVCRRPECQGGSSLAGAVPVLVLSGSSGVRACMGVLSPAVKGGVKVQVSKGWCTNGSSEPVKYSTLLGVQGVLDEEVAPGLWSVKWPSSHVNTAQFCDPFPLVGTPGQGLAVNVALALKDRIDSVCGTAAMQEKLVSKIVKNLCEAISVHPGRVSIVQVQLNTIILRFHRSVTSDTRTPAALAETLVSLINSGVTKKRVPEIDRGNIIILAHSSAQKEDSIGAYALANIATLKNLLFTSGQMGSLEYAEQGHEQAHLSQVRRADTSAASLARRRGALEFFAASIVGLSAVVELNVVGGGGLHSEVLENFSLRPDLQRKILVDLARAALPEVISDQQLQLIAESMHILSVEQHGFEVINAQKKADSRQQSFRTVLREGMARLRTEQNGQNLTRHPNSTRLIASLRFSMGQDTLELLPDVNVESGEGGGVGGGRLKEWAVLFALRIAGVVLNRGSPLYAGRSVVTQMVEEGSTLAVSLDLQLPDRTKDANKTFPETLSRTSTPRDAFEVGVMGGYDRGGDGVGAGAVWHDKMPLIKSRRLCVALLQGAAPHLDINESLALLEESHNNMLEACDALWRKQAMRKSAAATPRMLPSTSPPPSPPLTHTRPQAPPAARGTSLGEEGRGKERAEWEEERVVREEDVCEYCRTGRMRGGGAGCEKCGGRCCFAGVRVRLRERVDPHHHLSVFKGCDGWLQQRAQGEPGRWLVRFQGAAEAIPASVGAGGIYDLCYPPAEARLSRHIAREAKAATHLRPERTRALYFGEQMTQHQSAAYGVLWPESQEAGEELVLPHTARAGARVIVSRAWCRGPVKASTRRDSREGRGSDARYGRFVGRIGTLTRPAVGGSWYASFEGLPGEYAFSVSGGVTALALVPAFYSSAVSMVSFSSSSSSVTAASSSKKGDADEPKLGGRQRVGAEMRLHVSFAFSRAFGPGDTVSVHLPGFSIGAQQMDEEEASLETAIQRAHDTKAVQQQTRASAEAARAAAEAATGTGEQAETAEELALKAAQEAEEAAAELKAAFGRAWATDARSVSGINAVKKTPVLVEQSRLQHVRGNKAPHCLTTRYETVTASEIRTPVHKFSRVICIFTLHSKCTRTLTIESFSGFASKACCYL
jgi:hypothetical protein